MDQGNKFGECCKCPALMNDGRIFTNYMLNSKFNSTVKELNNIKTQNEYRHFLQQNAETIMDKEQTFLHENKRCDFTLLNN